MCIHSMRLTKPTRTSLARSNLISLIKLSMFLYGLSKPDQKNHPWVVFPTKPAQNKHFFSCRPLEILTEKCEYQRASIHLQIWQKPMTSRQLSLPSDRLAQADIPTPGRADAIMWQAAARTFVTQMGN